MEPVITVLHAEADPLQRHSTAQYLNTLGYQALEAENGLEAWEIFQRERPDLVLTDLRMPVMDGFELLTRVTAKSPETPILILSGVGTMTDLIEALHLGAWDYLTKPITETSILLYAVEKALERSKMLRDSRNYQQLLEQTVRARTQKLEDELKERKKIERLIIRAKQEWERTMDAMPDLIALLDINQRMMRVNKPMAAALGLTPAEAVGQKCYDCVHSKRCPPEQCPHIQMLADGQSHTIEMDEERLGGTFKVIAVPRYDFDNTTLIGSIHIIRDITARKEAEKEQNKLQSQLLHARKVESMGQLAAGIAHEINTPIHYVGTNIDFLDETFHDISKLMDQLQTLLAEKDGILTPQQFTNVRQALNVDESDWEHLSAELPSAIGQSRDGLKRVTSIIRSMKKFSHPGSRDKVAVNLNDIIHTTIIAASHEWKHVAEIETDLDPALPSVPCLADELGQVILNMLENAVLAIGEKLGDNPKRQKGMITLATRQEGKWVELRISDTGSGIPETIRLRIFDPFFTTKQVGKVTGQGLAGVHDIITGKHQGTIALASEVGIGTTFIIRLPQNN